MTTHSQLNTHNAALRGGKDIIMKATFIDLNLTMPEAQVIYIALSRISFSGVDDTAQALIRYKLEKLTEEQTGKSLHDYLLIHDAIPENTEHPIRGSEE